MIDLLSDVNQHFGKIGFNGSCTTLLAPFFSSILTPFFNQEYTSCLNEFRVKMRSSHLKQSESAVSVEVTQVSEAYHELLNRSNRLADRFLRVGSKSKDYNDAMERAKRWLKETEPKVSKICSEPIGAEPRVVEDQVDARSSGVKTKSDPNNQGS